MHHMRIILYTEPAPMDNQHSTALFFIHAASTDDVLLRNLTKVWMIKEEFINNCFSLLTKIFLPKK